MAVLVSRTTPPTFRFASGQAVDAVAFRAIPETKGVDLAVSYADRKGILYRD
jgi:hypothetical protein